MTHGATRVTPADLRLSAPLGEALLALNNAHAVELSRLDPGRLELLVAQAFLAARVGTVDAFLLAFDERADYDSPNFRWFRAGYDRFVYVDRVVVAPGARGRGLGRRLYDDLFAEALASGHRRIVCEVNVDPPNPASDTFHATLGFAEVGRARLPESGKVVRYLAREFPAGGAA
ncbi:MAG TPA: GNAT family N-acetyltransferase [Amaricoccus sp.]|uniref:GNAT family N-acetyltransferase n=1 Tax=Amaricoccus sp. TaxID=1872485 RepID=UPI002C70674F|nr:GNAT family N-acetyltransferase [Amaricoccus sp.]HMQ94475.1 GNAT family N-acetyltransferase [Amaricoccus sp.]HMR54686.1 GNAT family N-acetyltransferase [Amaricoccus sp.]HMR61567.1 GNAT family N-acetyltransferase [Amaricoccus sp.]HMU01715.1 GNAT family N-acetyltransferase [Amaricoccus sp.]